MYDPEFILDPKNTSIEVIGNIGIRSVDLLVVLY